MNDLIFYPAALVIAVYIFCVWLADLRAYRRWFASRPGAAGGSIVPLSPIFPGATPVGWLAVAVAVAGAAVLLMLETFGELKLGIVGQQTEMTLLFGLYTLAAAFVEELIFRGYLYYDKGTQAQLIGSIVGVSLVFAVLHPYLWNWTGPKHGAWRFWEGNLSPDFGVKAVFSTSIVFARSLWFYCLRFWPANPRRSLIPCIAAHLASNVGVICIKALQGKIAGWY